MRKKLTAKERGLLRAAAEKAEKARVVAKPEEYKQPAAKHPQAAGRRFFRCKLRAQDLVAKEKAAARRREKHLEKRHGKLQARIVDAAPLEGTP